MRKGAMIVVVVGAVALLGANYDSGRGTSEDSVIMEFGGSPGNIPHIGYVAPDPGRLLFLFATGHNAGTGAGETTLAAVRSDGGVLCAVTVPCTLADGAHVPADGGVVECEAAQVSNRELVEFEPLDNNCALPPVVKVQAAFYWQ